MEEFLDQMGKVLEMYLKGVKRENMCIRNQLKCKLKVATFCSKQSTQRAQYEILEYQALSCCRLKGSHKEGQLDMANM